MKLRVGQKALWNSPRGYSHPDEAVTITAIDEGRGIAQIRSEPDTDEPGNGFFYWVQFGELSPIPAQHASVRAILNLPADQRAAAWHRLMDDATVPAAVRAVAAEAWAYCQRGEGRDE